MVNQAYDLATKSLTQQVQLQELRLKKADDLAPVRELSDKYVSRFFARISASFGSKFLHQFKSEESLDVSKQVWRDALAKLTDQQVVHGLRMCEEISDWMPNTSEFIRMACNLPNFETCSERVLRGDNRDNVSYRISGVIGQYNMKSLSHSQLKSRIKGLYSDMYQLVLNQTMGNDDRFYPSAGITKGKDMNDPANFTKVEPEVAEPYFVQMKRMLQGAESA